MNKIILLGRLTKDPETIYTQTNNTIVVKFTLAVNRRFAKQGEERQTDFFNIIAYGKIAEFISKYYLKGQQVLISGRLQNRSWEDEQEKKHYVTEVICEESYFADSNKNQISDEKTMNETSETVLFENSYEDDDLPF